MNIDILKHVDNKMKLFEKENLFKKKNIFVGGTDYVSMYIIKWLEENAYLISGVFSITEKEIGQTIMGYEIQGIEQLLIPYKKNNIVLLSEYFDIPFNNRMDVLGYYDYVQRFVVTTPIAEKRIGMRTKEKVRTLIKRPFINGVLMVLRGDSEYKKIKRTMKSGEKIYLFPHRSLGDVFILGQYRASKAKKFSEDYVLVVIGEVCKKVALQSGFEQVISVDQKTMDGLVALSEAMGNQLCNDLEVLHFCYFYTEISSYILYDKQIPFLEAYNYLVFNQKNKLINTYTEDKQEAIAYCRKIGINKGKTVILAPYAKSIMKVNLLFWERLVNDLEKKGYEVYTNCSSEDELEIYGSKRILFPIEIANSVVEYAGYFIGLRSGLCDVIANSKSKKIIIYPKAKMGKMRLIDYYSLKAGNDDNCIEEIECAVSYETECVGDVIKLIENFSLKEK